MPGTGTTYKDVYADAVLGSGAPATVLLHLYSAAPSDAGGGTELVGDGYAPIEVDNDVTNWPAAGSGQKANAVELVSPDATADWDAITHWGLQDPDDDLIHWGSLQDPITVLSGQHATFPIGSIVVRVT